MSLRRNTRQQGGRQTQNAMEKGVQMEAQREVECNHPSEGKNKRDRGEFEKSSSPDAVLEHVPSSGNVTSDEEFNALAEEEDRLRQEREAKQKSSEVDKKETLLDKKKYEQLNLLLDQTDLYSKFLSEQMNAIETETNKSNEDDNVFLPLMKGGELRKYQLKGIKWLISLWQNGLNGILADQMGLGKTVQAIGFISHLWDKRVMGPFIAIAPLSTLSNWVDEFQRWAPDIPVLLYHGSADDRARIRYEILCKPITRKFPIIITSYEIVVRDSKFLQKFNYKYMVVDEGHRLKNFDCKLIRELRCFNVGNKLLLTGTPLQNNLSELWSLLNFLLPDVFASLQDFERWFDFSEVDGEEVAAQEQHQKIIGKLHSILKPFLLRRLKVDVEISLPMKKEIILYPTMTDYQKKLNKQLVDRTLIDNMGKLAKKSRATNADMGKLKNVLMQMRKNCNHPDLITGDYDGSLELPSASVLVEQCGKMHLLERLLDKLREKGHKVLIFSQMTKMLDLMESYLDEKGCNTCRIDGGVPCSERKDMIKKFNTDDAFQYFLLSTRAGGLGINLTAADTVIIYDSDWNPQQDLQAMDRCHRIGQTKPVLVFRMITANSVEEKMLKRAESKLKLERLVIKKGAFLHDDQKNQATFNAEDLRDILQEEACVDDKGVKGVDISDKDLDKLLDRSTMEQGKPIKAFKGKGYEVLPQSTGGGLLSGVNA